MTEMMDCHLAAVFSVFGYLSVDIYTASALIYFPLGGKVQSLFLWASKSTIGEHVKEGLAMAILFFSLLRFSCVAW